MGSDNFTISIKYFSKCQIYHFIQALSSHFHDLFLLISINGKNIYFNFFFDISFRAHHYASFGTIPNNVLYIYESKITVVAFCILFCAYFSCGLEPEKRPSIINSMSCLKTGCTYQSIALKYYDFKNVDHCMM